MKINVSPEQLKIIIAIFQSSPAVKASAFGSRVKGENKEFSDLDLVIQSPIGTLELSNLREKLENSNLPFKIDLVVWEEISDNFKTKIKKDLISIC